MRRVHKHGDEQIRALRQQFHDFKDSYDDMNFTGPYLSTITARTLIVHGDRDEFFPVSIPVEMYRSIPNAALWIVPSGGHVPIFDPKVPFVATALDFLSSPPVGDRRSEAPARAPLAPEDQVVTADIRVQAATPLGGGSRSLTAGLASR
jgi:hypothetical protein